MRVVKPLLLSVLVIGVLVGVVFGALWVKRYADARSLEGIVIEPAPPQPPPPKEAETIDPRLLRYDARADRARLLYAPKDRANLVSVSFIDNDTLVVSSNVISGKETRSSVLRLDVQSGSSTVVIDGLPTRQTSNHRAAHRNAGRLCYAERDMKKNIFDVWCSDLDGKNGRQVTKHDGKEDLLAPAISPDGTWVAFEVDSERPKRQGATIWKIRLDGSDIQQLTRGADDRRPTWSDDGRKIYFQRRPVSGTASWDMYAMDADGKNPSPILRTQEEDELFPVRRASRDEFVVIEAASGTEPRLKKIDAITKAGEYLTDGRSGPETSPSVSPDGALVAFLAPLGPQTPSVLGIWVAAIE